MKPAKFIIILFTAVLISLMAVPVCAAQEISVVVNGNKVTFNEVMPEIYNNRVYLPIKEVAEMLHISTEYAADESTYYLSRGNIIMSLQPNNKTMTMGYIFNKTHKNKEQKHLDAAPIMKDNRFMLPIRFVMEPLGNTVTWDAETRTVAVTDNYISNINNKLIAASGVLVMATPPPAPAAADSVPPEQESDDTSLPNIIPALGHGIPDFRIANAYLKSTSTNNWAAVYTYYASAVTPELFDVYITGLNANGYQLINGTDEEIDNYFSEIQEKYAEYYVFVKDDVKVVIVAVDADWKTVEIHIL